MQLLWLIYYGTRCADFDVRTWRTVSLPSNVGSDSEATAMMSPAAGRQSKTTSSEFDN